MFPQAGLMGASPGPPAAPGDLRFFCILSSKFPLWPLCEGRLRNSDREKQPTEERPQLGGRAQCHQPQAACAQVGVGASHRPGPGPPCSAVEGLRAWLLVL